MGTAFAIAVPMVALMVLAGWAVWHLIYDKKTFPEASPTTHHVDLDELADQPDLSEMSEVKETPATSQLNIPPAYLPPQSSDKTGYSISGMGGSWKPLSKLVPKRRHHWQRMPSDEPKM